jgi:hypothetical protein
VLGDGDAGVLLVVIEYVVLHFVSCGLMFRAKSHFLKKSSDQTENTTDEQVLWEARHMAVFAQPDMERHEHRHVPSRAGSGKESALDLFHVQKKVHSLVPRLQVLHPVHGHPHAYCVAWDRSNVKV